MKILAFTDTHSSDDALRKVKEKSKSVDLIVCGGDITIFGNGQNKALKFLDSIGKKILIIHGNHEDSAKFRKACSRLKNLEYIHNKVYTEGSYSFIGYGDGGFSFRDAEFMSKAKDIIKKIPKGNKIVLVSHGPPYNTSLDKLFERDHCGSKDIRKFIIRYKPVLVITGHLHENEGKKDKIGNTRIINPGAFGRIIRI